MSSVRRFVEGLPAERLEKIRIAAGELVALLERETQLPSALTLTSAAER